MARKNPRGMAQKAEAPQNTHGQCANAYGYCMPGCNGQPICCRCELHPEYLKLCREKACRDFAMRTEPVPERVDVRLSGPRSPEGKEKVVPVFDPENPRVVLEYVPAGEFAKRNREPDTHSS